MHRVTLHRRLVDTATPLLFLGTASALLRGGSSWAPQWVVNLMARSGVTSVQTTTLCACALAAAACIVVAWRNSIRWQRMVARTGLVALAFASVAEGAAILAQPPVAGQLQGASALLWVGVELAISLGLLISIDRTRVPDPESSTLAGRHVALSLVLAVAAIAVIARIPVADTIELERLSGQGYEPIELDTAQWVGHSLPDTGLSRHLPVLTALTLEGDSIIVLYNPRCSHCHELFQEHLGPERTERIVAIEVPPPKALVEAAGDGVEELDCKHCSRVALPAGPMWLVEIPTVVRLRNGVVTCVATKDFEQCLTPAVSN